MISAAYCRMMARYSRWQNRSLMACAGRLTPEQRWQDRGAFFGSIAATFNHLLWDDALWLARFGGDERPEDTIDASLAEPRDWEAFQALRHERDAELLAWADGLADADLGGVVAWFPGGADTRIEKPTALCVAHLFNHQTHHRGQIHAMLTAAGQQPEPTDLPMLEEAG
ncbi:MAG: DinB family protein [Pseudomonadota bacterium]